MGGASSARAALGEAPGGPALARRCSVAAALGSAAGVAALIHDLGRPERFLNMLRVAKPTSPLSIGSWILATYGTLAGAAGASTVTGLLPRLGRAASTGAALLSPAMMTYTAVLVADTALELAAERRMVSRLGLVAEPYRQGRPGRLMRASQLLTTAGALGALAGRRSRLLSALSSAALFAGALCSRFGVFEAGEAPGRDPE